MLGNISSYKLTLTATDNLPFQRMEKLDELMQAEITAAQEQLTLTEKDIEVAKKELGSPFYQEERYKELTGRLVEITKALEEQDKQEVVTKDPLEEVEENIEPER